MQKQVKQPWRAKQVEEHAVLLEKKLPSLCYFEMCRYGGDLVRGAIYSLQEAVLS